MPNLASLYSQEDWERKMLEEYLQAEEFKVDWNGVKSQKGGSYSMLNELKSFDPNHVTIEQLIALSAFGKSLQTEYEENGVEAPAWVGQRLTAVQRMIREKNHDALKAKETSIRAQLESMKTPAEKKADLRKQLTATEKLLQNA